MNSNLKIPIAQHKLDFKFNDLHFSSNNVKIYHSIPPLADQSKQKAITVCLFHYHIIEEGYYWQFEFYGLVYGHYRGGKRNIQELFNLLDFSPYTLIISFSSLIISSCTFLYLKKFNVTLFLY